MKLPVLNNERPEVCGPCGGSCCKSGSGVYHPSDFEDLARDLPAAVASGKVAIDFFLDETYEKIYMPRPQSKGWESKRRTYWTGDCTNLTETGCALPFPSRPKQCRDLVPSEPEKPCRYPEKPDDMGILEWASRPWVEHQELLRELL